MSDVVLIAEPYGSMLFAPEVPCLIVQWHGFARSVELRSLLDRGLALYEAKTRQCKPLGWLADTRQLGAVRAETQQWLKDDWNPRAAAAGIRHVSLVVPETVFGQISVGTYSANAAAAEAYCLTSSQHHTLDVAKAWLREQLQQKK
ncbi:hypothetical protein [Hymenobacter sp. PAMC 26628]|uniref:hypothetical protein n=1 Tax=Hymenobacter sp. PAMC 26628 TaxID=1484118 RepID=UPI0007700279|nr:hypothetical protein [Hymenobacter sp. PAMC 26628]AMJ65255.1 hypothetical protein AXW84_07320 [Hymenobacter sp. PAMC 26628]